MPDIETEAPALFRGMLRDIVACSDYAEVCRMMELVPAGPDVDQVEHYKSHMRLNEFSRVADSALVHADVAADVLYRLTRICDPDAEDDERSREMFHILARTALTTVLAHLMEKGTLEVVGER
jgi:hypothetical protein